MQKRISNLPFTGTPEQEEKLNAVLARHKGEKGAIMPCLQAVSYTHLDVYKREGIDRPEPVPLQRWR